MMLQEKELNRLINRASYLHERLEHEWQPAVGAAQKAAAERRLDRWCQLAAGGDWDLFLQRLAWDGLDKPSALNIVSDGTFLGEHEQSRPPWANFLADVFAGNIGEPSQSSDDYEQSLHPFTATAQKRLQQSAGVNLDLLHPSARQSLADYLTERLIKIATPTFNYIRNQAPYTSFASYMHQDGLETLCHTYPVLARQLATQAEQWVAEICDFLERFKGDWPSLASQTGESRPLVTACQPGLSDPHQGGRTVWQVSLANGVTVAYKPKNMVLDHGWNNLLAWCNRHGLAPQLAELWVLPRQEYGWMAWATADPTSAQLKTAYQNGMLLRLLHLLHASDCHQENLEIQGDQPVLIDAEMLRYPQVAGQQAADPLNVMRTGLLPRWRVTGDGYAEIGGLRQAQPSSRPFALELAEGYRTMDRFLSDIWPQLQAQAGPLAPFRRGEVRFAPRPTAVYLRLLDHVRQPALLQNGIDFSIEVDRLAHSYLHQEAHGHFRPLLLAEHLALAQGDVPLFQTEIGQPHLKVSNMQVEDCFVWPPIGLPEPITHQAELGLILSSLDRSTYLFSNQKISYLGQALSIGKLLADRAVVGKDGRLNWIATRYQAKSGLYQPSFIGDDVYTGRAGIALFLTALERASGDGEWGRLASGGIQTSTLTHVQPAKWGVLDGQAGLLLELLRNIEHLGQAVACGDRILAAEAVWQDAARGLGGFSHGAAGIAYALIQLYEVSGQGRFLAGAIRGWAFQQSLYETSAGNWQDRRGQTKIYLNNWCNGAAGIGLAAAGCLASIPELLAVVEHSVSLITSAEVSPIDTLCCGTFGQIECLLEMGLLTKRQAWVDQAHILAQTALKWATDQGNFLLYDNLHPNLFNPTFFRGVAGIGYTLLRLLVANGELADQLPCVLRWGDLVARHQREKQREKQQEKQRGEP